MKRLDIIKKVWQIASPLTASRIFNVFSNFIGFFMVAHLGRSALAASALITAIQASLFLIMTSLLFSVGVVVGHAFGARRYNDIGAILQQGWFLGLCVSVIGIAISLSIKFILMALGQEMALINIVQKYFDIYCIALPSMVSIISVQQFLIAVGKQKVVFYLSVFSFCGFIVFAPILIYGAGIIPKFGVMGMAMAFAIQSWITLSVYLAICFKHSEFQIYKIKEWHLPKSFHYFRKLLTIGWPISLQVAGDILSFFFITIIVGWIGENALAAQQIVTQYYILLVVPILTLSQASSILVSQAKGAGNIPMAKEYGNTTLFVGLFFSLIIILIFIFFPHTLINIYTHDQASAALLQLTTIILILTGCRLLLDTIIEIKIGSLRGLFDTRTPMFITLFCIWVLYIPFAYFLGFTLSLGLIGITIASIIVSVIGALALWLRWVYKIKRQTVS